MDKVPMSPQQYDEYGYRMAQNAWGYGPYNDALRRAAMNTYQQPKQRTNAIGIPLIRAALGEGK